MNTLNTLNNHTLWLYCKCGQSVKVEDPYNPAMGLKSLKCEKCGAELLNFEVQTGTKEVLDYELKVNHVLIVDEQGVKSYPYSDFVRAVMKGLGEKEENSMTQTQSTKKAVSAVETIWVQCNHCDRETEFSEEKWASFKPHIQCPHCGEYYLPHIKRKEKVMVPATGEGGGYGDWKEEVFDKAAKVLHTYQAEVEDEVGNFLSAIQFALNAGKGVVQLPFGMDGCVIITPQTQFAWVYADWVCIAQSQNHMDLLKDLVDNNKGIFKSLDSREDAKKKIDEVLL